MRKDARRPFGIARAVLLGARATGFILLLSCPAVTLVAQEMQPRAYFPAPVGVNFFGASYSNNRGGLLLDPSLPVEDSHVVADVATLSFGQTLGVLGRWRPERFVRSWMLASLT